MDVFENREFSLDRELWHEYEVPLAPLHVKDFYHPNLFDHVFKTHAAFVAALEKLLGKNKDRMLCPYPLYASRDSNEKFLSRRVLVLDGRIYGGIPESVMMVKQSWQDALDGIPEADSEPYILPMYPKCNEPRQFMAMWDQNDGLSAHVGMEVVLSKKYQVVEGHPPIINKVTNFFGKTQTNMLCCSDSGSLH